MTVDHILAAILKKHVKKRFITIISEVIRFIKKVFKQKMYVIRFSTEKVLYFIHVTPTVYELKRLTRAAGTTKFFGHHDSGKRSR